jgi:dTMP kinase
MSAGLFIVLEGPDGSGKSTLMRPLVERMRQAGVDPVVVREPGGTPAAEMARKAVLDPEHHLAPMAELFFYLAARSDLVRSVIRPALDEGRVVVSDRFALTTEAYQMAGRGLPPEVVIPANRAAADGLVPDLTLVLDLPPALGRARQEAAGKPLDRLERESPEFHRRVVEFYRAVQGSGVRHLDACLPPDRLLQAAWAAVLAVAPERFRPTIS